MAIQGGGHKGTGTVHFGSNADNGKLGMARNKEETQVGLEAVSRWVLGKVFILQIKTYTF